MIFVGQHSPPHMMRSLVERASIFFFTFLAKTSKQHKDRSLQLCRLCSPNRFVSSFARHLQRGCQSDIAQ